MQPGPCGKPQKEVGRPELADTNTTSSTLRFDTALAMQRSGRPPPRPLSHPEGQTLITFR
jgi:hypothetical protein